MKWMKRWLVVCSILVGAGLVCAGAYAQALDDPAEEALAATDNKETWIRLEDLPVDDQNAALDAEEKDHDKRSAASAFSEATSQLVAHALFAQALEECGVDLLAGAP